MTLNSVSAEMLLMKCEGDSIWDEQTCRCEGVPELWIEELVDNFESGFDSDRNIIYQDGSPTNQYRGVLDLHLAYKLAEFLGIDWQRVVAHSISRQSEVAALQSALDEL